MNGTIGRLECRYAFAAPERAAAAMATAQLDRLLADRVPTVLGDALERALGDEETVVVIRHIDVGLTWIGAVDDAALSRAWGERLAASVLRTLATGDGVARFDSPAHHAGHFLADLVGGHAWDRWIHGSFASLRGLGTAGAARTVLREHADQLAAVLSVVRQLGALDTLLELVDDGHTLERLCDGGARHAVRPEDDPAYPLVVTAARLADRLRLWRTGRPAFAVLWRAQCEAGVPPVSWRDRRGLSTAFAGMLDAFRRAGHLRSGEVEPEALRVALCELDWLDPAPVEAALAPLVPPATLPSIAAPRVTAAQRRIVSALAALLRDGALRLAGGRALHADVMRALAALGPELAGDSATRLLVQRLLDAGGMLRAEAVPRLAAGDGEGALALLPPDARPAVTGAYRLLARLGPDAVVVAGAGHPEVGAGSPAPVASACAGAALLLRAAADVRLPRLAERAAYPAADVVLLSLALRWSGPGGVVAGRVDPGLALLLDTDRTIEDLRATWRRVPAEAHRRWREELGEWLELRDADVWDEGGLGIPDVDRAIGVAATALVRAWARWLRGFSRASAPFLLEQLIRRPGIVTRAGDDVVVALERRPLDVVLPLGGLSDDLDLRLLGGRGRMRFALEAA